MTVTDIAAIITITTAVVVVLRAQIQQPIGGIAAKLERVGVTEKPAPLIQTAKKADL